MTMRLHKDFRDLVAELNAAGVEYILVGAIAMAAHGIPRYTRDLDIFFRPTTDNAARLVSALARFGYSSADVTAESLVDLDNVHFIGRYPVRIEFLNSISGVSFDDAWGDCVTKDAEGVPVNVLSIENLIANKRASGRPKDIADLDVLDKGQKRKPPA